MAKTPTLTEALNSLKTSEARAGAVFELITKPSNAVAVEIDGLTGDVLRTGIGIAFQQGDFKKGFAMAKKGGILEEIVSELVKASIKLEKYWQFNRSGEERGDRGIPETIRKLPGFSYDFNEPYYSDEKREKIIPWIKARWSSSLTET